MPRTEKQFRSLLQSPNLTLECLQVFEDKVLRNERQAYQEFQANLARRKAQRAYKLSLSEVK
jgi:hypothetical protein